MNVESLLIVEDISEAMASLIRIAQAAFPEARIDMARNMKEARLHVVQRQWSMARRIMEHFQRTGLSKARVIA